MAVKSVMQRGKSAEKSCEERSKRVTKNDRSVRGKKAAASAEKAAPSKFERGPAAKTMGDKSGEDGIKKKPKQPAKKPANKIKEREKMKEGQELKSELFQWKVTKLLGSGGFGDVYKVSKLNNEDKKEYAMKTEMVLGDKRMLRLKIEVTVLKACHEIPEPEKKKHFVEFVDRGITDKFKFLVMELVGPSLEDIRRQYLMRGYSTGTAMICAMQTLTSLRDLHILGWLHRDIKPQNFAVGIGPKEDIVYMLDFGIARKIFNGESKDSKDIKVARVCVKFLGTLRFASRACHRCLEQGRKDDIETWIYMVYDLLDDDKGLPWKRAANRDEIVLLKEKFFNHGFPKMYERKKIPAQFMKLLDYIGGLRYHDEPDYQYMADALKAICHDNKIIYDKPEWMGKLVKKDAQEEGETSSDNKQSGSADGSDEGSKREGKKGGGGTKEMKSMRTKTKTHGGNSIRGKKNNAAALSMRTKKK